MKKLQVLVRRCMRESGKNDEGLFEDEYLYEVLCKDWESDLYDKIEKLSKSKNFY